MEADPLQMLECPSVIDLDSLLLDVPRCNIISNPAPAYKKRSLLVLRLDEGHVQVVYRFRFINER